MGGVERLPVLCVIVLWANLQHDRSLTKFPSSVSNDGEAVGEEAVEIGAHGVGIGADAIEDDEIARDYPVGQQERARQHVQRIARWPVNAESGIRARFDNSVAVRIERKTRIT